MSKSRSLGVVKCSAVYKS